MPIDKAVSSAHCHLTMTEDLNYTLKRFWEVEHNVSAPSMSKEELDCEKHFLKHSRRNQEGRFIVQLPVRIDKLEKLGDSKEAAMRCYKALEKRLIARNDIYVEYKNFMQEYRKLKHMREVVECPGSTTNYPSYYLPHHPVYKETSTTTKLRVVFDASCKTSTGISLNDVLMVGPTVQDNLFSILIRFRIFKIAITADIAKMYRQVLLDSSQTSLQRIFWRDSLEDPIKICNYLR